MRVIIFLLLKVVEIGGVIFLPYWVGDLMERINYGKYYCELHTSFGLTWIGGFQTIAILIWAISTIGIIVYWVWRFIFWNWKLANKLWNKIRRM